MPFMLELKATILGALELQVSEALRLLGVRRGAFKGELKPNLSVAILWGLLKTRVVAGTTLARIMQDVCHSAMVLVPNARRLQPAKQDSGNVMRDHLVFCFCVDVFAAVRSCLTGSRPLPPKQSKACSSAFWLHLGFGHVHQITSPAPTIIQACGG